MKLINRLIGKKCPIYKNKNISIINLNTNQKIETGICRINESRRKTDIFFCPLTKLLSKSWGKQNKHAKGYQYLK